MIVLAVWGLLVGLLAIGLVGFLRGRLASRGAAPERWSWSVQTALALVAMFGAFVVAAI